MNKLVVYTAITNNYDSLKEPSFITPNTDYVCFTDNEELKSDTWKIRLIKDVPNLDHTRKTRRYKILPHLFLGEYEYSIWIDARYQVKGNMLDFIRKHLSNSTLSVYTHPKRNCIYKEAKAVVSVKKEVEKIAKKQCNFYKKNRYPKKNGLIASGIILRKHNDPIIINLMEDWWEQVILFSKRDQLSFNYVAWKNKFKYNIITEGENYKNNYFDIFKHLK